MREKIAEALKTAMKAQDKRRLPTLRLIQAAIQDRDIANRGAGKDPASDDEILQILAKMVKQREESAKAFEDGKRPELAAQERERDRRSSATSCRSSWTMPAIDGGGARGDRRDRCRQPEGHGQGDGRAEAEICRPDGFRQGQRHRQGAAAVGRPERFRFSPNRGNALSICFPQRKTGSHFSRNCSRRLVRAKGGAGRIA